MKKEHNIMSAHGITDQEYIDEFGLDPAIANTPEINEAMFEMTYQGNLVAEEEALLEAGETPEVAKREAKKISGRLNQDARRALKRVQKQRGY